MADPARAAIANHPDFLEYDFGSYHPLRPERISASLDLLRSAGLWFEESELLTAEASDPLELELVHSPAYIRAVEEAGSGHGRADHFEQFGLSSTDNPPFPDMHRAAALIAGGSAQAVRRIMAGSLDHAFNGAGGLHHALRARASGFCVYNDPALAAAIAIREFNARVLYIDLDCHHGDGVQWIFYDEPDVCTLSFHESGEYLFPGSGEIGERGEGGGEGYAFNVPFMPYTRDAAWIAALQQVLPSVAEWYRPDLIISSHGADTHAWDPLTHLSLTTASFREQASLIHQLAHGFANGRWLAVGSGGYDWRRVVPRSWAIVWAEMTDRELPEDLPADWTDRWLEDTSGGPAGFLDPPGLGAQGPQYEEIDWKNERTLEEVMDLISSQVARGDA